MVEFQQIAVHVEAVHRRMPNAGKTEDDGFVVAKQTDRVIGTTDRQRFVVAIEVDIVGRSSNADAGEARYEVEGVADARQRDDIVASAERDRRVISGNVDGVRSRRDAQTRVARYEVE